MRSLLINDTSFAVLDVLTQMGTHPDVYYHKVMRNYPTFHGCCQWRLQSPGFDDMIYLTGYFNALTEEGCINEL